MPVRTPKLDFSFLDQRSLIYQDRINRSRLLGDIAQGVIGAVQEGARYKRAQEVKSQAELAEAMAFDTNITGDHIIDTKLTQWYNDYLKEPGTALLYDKKGKITGVDKIALKTKQKEFIRIANFWKNEFLADVNNAKKTSFSSQNQGLYDYDGDEIQRIYDDLINDRMNLADGPAYYNKVYADKYDTGQYFVSMRPIDPSVTVEKKLADFQKATKRPIGKRTVVVEKDGKKYTTSVDDYEYGTADEFIEFAKSSIASDRDRGAWMVKGIGLALSPDEQMKAMELYPEKEITEVFNDYFWDQKVRPKAEKILNPKPIVDTRVEPITRKEDRDEDKEPQVRTIEIPGTNLKFNNAVDLSTIPDTESQKRSLSGFILPNGAMKITGKDGETTTEKSFPELKKQGDYIIDWYDLKEGFIQVHSTDKYGRLQYYLVPIKKNEYILSKIKSFKTPEPSEEKNKVNEVVRMTKDGREAIFDADTKEFIRYAR